MYVPSIFGDNHLIGEGLKAHPEVAVIECYADLAFAAAARSAAYARFHRAKDVRRSHRSHLKYTFLP